MSSFNSQQHFETHDSKTERKFEKSRKNTFWITPFWNPCNIVKYLKN